MSAEWSVAESEVDCARRGTLRRIDSKRSNWSADTPPYETQIKCYADEARTNVIACDASRPNGRIVLQTGIYGAMRTGTHNKTDRALQHIRLRTIAILVLSNLRHTTDKPETDVPLSVVGPLSCCCRTKSDTKYGHGNGEDNKNCVNQVPIQAITKLDSEHERGDNKADPTAVATPLVRLVSGYRPNGAFRSAMICRLFIWRVSIQPGWRTILAPARTSAPPLAITFPATG